MPTKAPTAARIHERHDTNRKAMARRLATHLRSTGDDMLTDPQMLAWLPKARLDAIARAAGETHVPHLDTWRVVITLLATPAPKPCTDCPFAGLPKDAF